MNKFQVIQNNEKDNDVQTNDDTNNDFSLTSNNTTPFVLRDKSKWLEFSDKLKAHKIQYTKTTSVKDSIKIIPMTVDDNTRMRKLLINDSYKFHTHQLAAEKNFKIVTKSIPNKVTEKKLTETLTEMDYTPMKVKRMLGKPGISIQMVTI